MFARKPSPLQSQSSDTSSKEVDGPAMAAASQGSSTIELLSPIGRIAKDPCDSSVTAPTSSPSAVGKKRSAPATTGIKSTKRGKSGSATAAPPPNGKGQQSLKGFFKSSTTLDSNASAIQGIEISQTSLNDDIMGPALRPAKDLAKTHLTPNVHMEAASLDSTIETPHETGAQPISGESSFVNASPTGNHRAVIQPQESVHDPVESKESWSKLFTKPAAPRCEGHDEPCVSLLTKKPGMNLGRSFWMCPRPLGPSGAKEKNTQWRCQTFIWCSDWNPNATNG